MYTELKTYQLIIALLKKYGIKHCVLSAGSRNVPFVHSVEEDDFFKCYSVVDERSAGYFALGLAQETKEPVVISCTSSTATCNYWPAVAEAFYQRVPLIVLTSDRNPTMLGNWEDQMIDQVGMYDRHVKKSVNLPIINDSDDEYYCERLINEALLELDHRGTGPVHINVPMKAYNNSFNIKELPEVKKIDRIFVKSSKNIWNEKIEKLKNAKKILIIMGQQSFVSDNLKKNMKLFFERYNSAIFADHMANLEFEHNVNLSVCMDPRYITDEKFKNMLPDIVISFGGNIYAGIKDQLRKFKGKFEHWLVQEDGKLVDTFKSITNIFECSPEYFFEYCNNYNNENKNNKKYFNELFEYSNNVKFPNEFEYSHVYAIQKVLERIPENSLLHLSINNSIRITNFFKINKNIKVYANIGTHGIDGCMSSFFGQAYASNNDAFLVIGDLAFFYDMNSLKIRHIKNNARILLINNEGGSEFYFNKVWKNEKSDLHTTARHNTKAEGWAKSNNFEYISANNKEEFNKNINKFFDKTSKKPILFEVFTEMKKDADVIYDFFDLSRPRTLKSEIIRNSKEFIKKTIGQEKAQKIVKILKNGK